MNSNKSFFKNMAKLAMQQLLVSCAQLVDTAMVTRLGNVVVSSVGVSSRWIFLMNLFYRVGTCQVEALAVVVCFRNTELLDHRAHGTVQDVYFILQ